VQWLTLDPEIATDVTCEGCWGLGDAEERCLISKPLRELRQRPHWELGPGFNSKTQFGHAASPRFDLNKALATPLSVLLHTMGADVKMTMPAGMANTPQATEVAVPDVSTDGNSKEHWDLRI